MEKKKIIFLDLLGQGPDRLDDYFAEEKAELCEIASIDGETGIDIMTVNEYEGWDYLVIPSTDRNEELRGLLERLGIGSERIVFFSETELLCGNEEEVEEILKPDYRKQITLIRMVAKYEEHIIGDYTAVTAEGCSYLHNSSDRLIMGSMYCNKENWARDDMLRFYRLAQKYYHFTEKQKLFCDIGANIGTTSIYFKKKIDPDIRILAFEPSPENYKMLRINMILNDIPEEDQLLVNMGVSDREEEVSFRYDAFNSGGSRILRGEETGDRIRTIPFDVYMKNEQLDPLAIKYIWVDVEGFEPYFVKGGMETLKQIDVPTVIEFSPAKYIENGCYREYMDTLKEIYGRYICMQDDEEKVREIGELCRYEHAETLPLYDLFLLK